MAVSNAVKGYPVPVLVLAVIAISTSAVLVRLVTEIHPVALALWRVSIVGVLLAPTLVAQRPSLSRKDAGLIALAGALLALHFWTWFASLHHTTVLRSTVLVCLTPIWAALVEWGVLNSPPRRTFWPGIAMAVLGVAVMGGLGQTWGAVSIQGDGLALLGGVLSALYLVVGRTVRQRVSIGPYGALICLACAGWLLGVSLVISVPLLDFPVSSWWVIAALALGPQLFGHIGLNYAVRYVSAALVSALILLEPVGATLLGASILGEIPSLQEMLGGGVILLGLAVVTIPTAQAGSSPKTSTLTDGE